MAQRSITEIQACLKTQRQTLSDLKNVVATGIGYKVSGGQITDELTVVCSVIKKEPLSALSARERIPSSVDGIATDVVESGRIVALANTDRRRPAPGGISIGHTDITAGTLGCLVRRNGELMILSNNHVLADSNAASPGDAILQPGPADGGRLATDHIANLQDFVPIAFNGGDSDCGIANFLTQLANVAADAVGSTTRLQAIRPQADGNLVDAAIAKPLNDSDVSADIIDIGMPQGVADANLGTAIKKSGRTTEFTQGTIQQIDVTVNVQYGGGRIATFTDQLMAGAMSQGGDSGSAVLDDQNQLVGLLFAGSDSTTIINRIDHVFSALQLTL